MSDLIGQMIGNYRIVSELGHGGMGNVYLGEQPSIGRKVAIKVLPTHFQQDRTFLERFNREVQVIAKLQHPRILPVIDYGEQNGLPYIVMALMEGGTLTDLIKEGPLPLSETVRYIGQIAEGLDYAHEQGVIHRDFKPSNVLLDKKGNVYLADFGIAKVTADTAQLTGSGMIGTPAYMAPEMTKPEGLSPLVDIYALGVTLYQLLTGQQPFKAETPIGVMMAHAVEPVPDIRELRPDLPLAFQQIIGTAMSKEPKLRYQSAGALASALQHIAEGAEGDDEPMTMEILPSSMDAETAKGQPRPQQTATVRAGYADPQTAAIPAPARAGLPKNVMLMGIGGAALIAAVALAAIFVPPMLSGPPTGTPGIGSGGPTPTEAASDGPRALEGHSDPVASVVFTPDGALISAGEDRKVLVWNPLTGELVQEFDNNDQVYRLVISPDGKQLGVGGLGGTFSLLSLEDGTAFPDIQNLPAAPLVPAFSGDGATVSFATRDVSFANISTSTGQWESATTTEEQIASLAYSPDGKWLAAGTLSGVILLYDVASGEVSGQLEGHTDRVDQVVFSDDSSLLASASADGTARVWNFVDGSAIDVLEGHTRNVTGIAFVSDQVVTSSEDGTVKVWDVLSGGLVRTLEGGAGPLNGVAVSMDLSLIAAAAEEDKVLLWPLSADSVKAGSGKNGPIAFMSERDGNKEIYIVNPDGSGGVNLTVNPAVDDYPAFSPDGSQISFTTDRTGEYHDRVFIMNVDGTNQHEAVPSWLNAGYAATWAADGSRLVASGYNTDYTSFALLHYLLDAGTVVQLFDSDMDEGYPAFAPDGSKIAFTEYDDNSTDIYVMNADGSGAQQITTSSDSTHPSWSPDGSQIVYMRVSSSDIWIINADGTDDHRLVDGYNPVWSPDGEWIAYHQFADNGAQIFIIRVNGTQKVQLTTGGGQNPAWGSQ